MDSGIKKGGEARVLVGGLRKQAHRRASTTAEEGVEQEQSDMGAAGEGAEPTTRERGRGERWWEKMAVTSTPPPTQAVARALPRPGSVLPRMCFQEALQGEAEERREKQKRVCF